MEKGDRIEFSLENLLNTFHGSPNLSMCASSPHGTTTMSGWTAQEEVVLQRAEQKQKVQPSRLFVSPEGGLDPDRGRSSCK